MSEVKDWPDELLPIGIRKDSLAGCVSVKDLLTIIDEIYPNIDFVIQDYCMDAVKRGDMVVEDEAYKFV